MTAGGGSEVAGATLVDGGVVPAVSASAFVQALTAVVFAYESGLTEPGQGGIGH